MAINSTLPRAEEDTATRFVSDQDEAENRGLVKKFVKRTYTLVDGPNSGQSVEYWVEEDLASTTSGNIIPADNKDEDSAHVSGDKGSFILAVRNDAFAALTSTNGDYSPLAVDSAGRVIVVGSKTPADAFANPTDAEDASAFGFVFNGTTWDRVREATADNLAATGIPASGNMLFDGTNWDRQRSDGVATGAALVGGQGTAGTPAGGVVSIQGVASGTTVPVDSELPTAAALSDAFANPTSPAVGSMGMLFDGTDWERQRVADAGGISGTTIPDGISLTTRPGNWAQSNAAAVGSASSTVKAAGGAGVRHVCKAISFGFSASTALGADATVTINLRDGASGAGTVLWTWVYELDTTFLSSGAPFVLALSGLDIFGSANTAMTLEFSAGVTNLRGFVNLSGYSLS